MFSISFRLIICVTFCSLLSCSLPCTDGIRSGTQVTYYSENHQKESEREYQNCLCNGQFKYYYPNGVVQAIGRCKNGLTIDSTIHYDTTGKEDGVLYYKEPGVLSIYRAFLPLGDIIEFDTKGTLSNISLGKTISYTQKRGVNYIEIRALNDSIFCFDDYAPLQIFDRNLKILFDIRDQKDSVFIAYYKKKLLNYQVADLYLKQGYSYRIDESKLAVDLYYLNSYKDSIRKKDFLFDLSE